MEESHPVTQTYTYMDSHSLGRAHMQAHRDTGTQLRHNTRTFKVTNRQTQIESQ